MPLTYVIDVSRSLVISTGSGEVTFDEIRSHQNRLLSDPEFSKHFDQLIDCRQVTTFHATYDQMRQAACRKLFSETSRRACVASRPFIFGIGRMLQAYNEFSDAPSITEVFYDLSSALGWLGREDLRGVMAG